MKQTKHNKYKNTGLIFELLSKQLTSDVLTNSGNSSLDIIKQYFKEGTELSKELSLYNALMPIRNINESSASKLVELVLDRKRSLNSKKLLREKYQLIGAIKNTYNITEFFNNRVQNFKVYGTIYKLLESNKIEHPAEFVELHNQLIEHIRSSKQVEHVQQQILFNEQDHDTQKLAFKLLISKFNEKYKTLNSEQRNLVNRYITENSNANSFRKFIYSEVTKIKNKLSKHSKLIREVFLQIKLNEVAVLSDSILTSKHITEDHISALVKYYELINLLQQHGKEKI